MKLKMILAAAISIATLSGCGGIGVITQSKVIGSVTLTSRDGGTTKFAPDSCQSGDHEDFLGFDFFSTGSKMQLRAVFLPLEPPVVRIRSFAEGEFADVMLRKADCTTFAPAIDLTNWTINDSRDFNVKVTLDCKTSKGERIEGTLSTDHCH